ARAAERERNRDTRRKIITGGLLIEWAERDQRAADFLKEVLARISREHDHKPFEGWTVPGPEVS
ncbi:conjugal transfer protein TraD, partial [Neoasaia chiangmaiensis]